MRAAPRPLAGLAVVAALIAATPRLDSQAPPASATPPLVTGVEAVGMTVSNMERSVAFFTNTLSFRPLSDVEVSGDEYDRLHGLFASRLRIVRLALGDEQIELTEYLTPRGRAVPADSRSNDLWFQHVAIIVSDMDAAYAQLRRHHVEQASPEPQRLPDWNPAAGGIRAFYFKDPDGHPLEILQFPPGKGDARWQRAGGPLFLGIDHTAIVVSDTAASLAFYRDRLGLRLAGESVNYGPEQERLNAVFGARLRISALRAATGPGVEFLEYLSPRNGRRGPDIQANDVTHWETTVRTWSSEAIFERLRGRWLVSPSIVAIRAQDRTIRSLLARDPDGHALKVVER